MKDIIGKFNDGGPVFTYTIIILLLVICGMFIWARLNKEYGKKWRTILANIGWVALAWGYLGRTFGLIIAFDKIAAAGEITPQNMAGGLKMALLGPLFGIVTFVLARIFILVLQLRAKKESYE